MPHDEIVIPKSVMPELPPGYEETSLGERMGAVRQFRNRSGVHVREYEDRFVVHLDRFDPRSEPLKHLLFDSPETLVALGAGARLTLNKRNKSLFFSPLAFFIAFLSFNSLFRLLKKHLPLS